MKTFTGFFSIVAVGLIAGAVFATSVSSPLPSLFHAGTDTGVIKIDYVSLLIGLILGVIISNLASVEWSRIPRRIAAWLVNNTDNFGYIILSAVLVFVVVYY